MSVNLEKPERPGRPYAKDLRSLCLDEQYPTWVKNNRFRGADLTRLRREVTSFDYNPLFTILLMVQGSSQNLLRRTLDSVMSQVYPFWELCVCAASPDTDVGDALSLYDRLDERIRVEYLNGNEGRARTDNHALSLASGEFVVSLEDEDEFSPDALFEIAGLLQKHRDADVIYSDQDEVDAAGTRSHPRFKPDWSPNLLLSNNYVSRPCFYKRRLLEELGGWREGFEGAKDYDLILRSTERTSEIYHVPKILYHRRETSRPAHSSSGNTTREPTRRVLSEALARRGSRGTVEDGLVEGSFRVRFEIEGDPKVSIIVPTKDNLSMLQSCIQSIERHTSYKTYELLVVDNGSEDPATVEYLDSIPHRVVQFREPFNFSRLNNMAVSEAGGEHVLFLNDDTQVLSDGWLEAMLSHTQRPEIGAVGAKLLYPEGRVQHAGVLVGIGNAWGPGVATHSHQHYPSDSTGYMESLVVDKDYSAVTAACMMLRRSVFEEVGGFEEDLGVAFNDVDLCLRIREKGYQVVFTPFARLYHHESASRGYGGNRTEALYMRKRWGEALDKDPYYNPNFSLGDGDFRLRADMLRPRILRPESENGAGTPHKHPQEMEKEELRNYINARQANARSSHSTGLIPTRKWSTGSPASRPDMKSGPATGPPPTTFFIVGQPKSGTSWVRSTLDAHPQISCLGEGKFFGRDFKKANPSSGGRLPSLYSLFADSEELKTWAKAVGPWIGRTSHPEARGRELERHTKGLARAAIEYFLEDERKKSGKPIVGDKTPAHIAYLQEINEFFPEARIIHVIRDGRDQAVSSMFHWWKESDKPQFSGLPPSILRSKELYETNRENFGPNGESIFDEEVLRGLARGWKENVTRAREDGPRLFGENYFEVKYEDLLESPEEIFAETMHFLNADFDRDLVKKCVRDNSFERYTKNRPRGTEDPKSFFRKGISGDWKNYFTERDRKTFDAVAGDLLVRLDYADEDERRTGMFSI